MTCPHCGAPGWTRVEDGLPGEMVDVLAYDPYFGPTVALRDGSAWWADGKLRIIVSHWRPLPEPPKGAE